MGGLVADGSAPVVVVDLDVVPVRVEHERAVVRSAVVPERFGGGDYMRPKVVQRDEAKGEETRGVAAANAAAECAGKSYGGGGTSLRKVPLGATRSLDAQAGVVVSSAP